MKRKATLLKLLAIGFWIAISMFVSQQMFGQLIGRPGSLVAAAAGGGVPAVLSDGNTIAWYEASSDNVTLADGDSISQWNDLSGDNYHWTATDPQQPYFHVDSITFDADDDRMGASFLMEDTATVYAVFRWGSYQGGEKFFYNALSLNMAENNADDGNLEFAAGGSQDIAVPKNERVIVCWKIVEDGTSSVTVNGGTVTEWSSSTISEDNSSLLGGTSGGTTDASFNGLIIRKGLDNATDSTAIYNYINNLYR